MLKNSIIKKLRKERGLTQSEAAKGIGISVKTLYRYEQGKVKRYNRETIAKIAQFYNLNLEDILEEYNYENE